MLKAAKEPLGYMVYEKGNVKVRNAFMHMLCGKPVNEASDENIPG